MTKAAQIVMLHAENERLKVDNKRLKDNEGRMAASESKARNEAITTWIKSVAQMNEGVAALMRETGGRVGGF